MRILRLSWVSLSLLSALWAATGFQDVPVAAAPSFAASDSSATASFPTGMQFALQGTTDGTVASIDLVYTEANLDTLELVSADFTQNGDAIEATADADFTINFLPVGIDLTYHWVVTFDDDSVFETEAQVAPWIDDRFDWQLAEGDGVQIYSYGRSQDFIDLMVGVSSKAVADMIALYQPEKTFPIRIWAYASGKDYAGTLATNSQEWSAGSAYPDLQVIQAVIPKNSESEVKRVLPHEVSHQVLHMATMNPFNSPATWIDEGLAVHAQVGGTEDYDNIVSDAIDNDEILSLRSLISAFPYDASQARLAYAQSYSAVGFIKNQWGDEGIQAIVLAYRDGNSHEDVIETALGMTMDELQDAWLASLTGTSSTQLRWAA
jgi:hypothetical protein